MNRLPERSVKGLFIQRSEITVDNAYMLVIPRSLSLRPAFVVLSLCLCGLVGQPVSASDHDDHDRARQAVQAGQVLPLPTVLERLQREIPGLVLEVELEHDDKLGAYYEIELAQPGGGTLELHIDARTQAILKRKLDD